MPTYSTATDSTLTNSTNTSTMPTYSATTNSTPQEQLFIEMAELSGAHVYQLGSPAELAALVERLAGQTPINWLTQRPDQLPLDAIPTPADLTATTPAPTPTSQSPAFPDPSQATLGITTAECAIAETGSVVLLESTRRQMLRSLLSKELLVLVPAASILDQLSDAAASITNAAASTNSAPAQQVTLLTGPSRTGDIELQHVNGIQGPFEVHLAICSFALSPAALP